MALLTAALDDRLAGVIAASAFTPLRSSKQNDGTEGVLHYSHLHGLAPRLGEFAGRETRIPIDYDEILAAIQAPMYLRAPALDRYAIPAHVRAAVLSAKKNGARIELSEPLDFNRFPVAAQREAWNWLEKQ